MCTVYRSGLSFVTLEGGEALGKYRKVWACCPCMDYILCRGAKLSLKHYIFTTNVLSMPLHASVFNPWSSSALIMFHIHNMFPTLELHKVYTSRVHQSKTSILQFTTLQQMVWNHHLIFQTPVLSERVQLPVIEFIQIPVDIWIRQTLYPSLCIRIHKSNCKGLFHLVNFITRLFSTLSTRKTTFRKL
jgi:hypothetical protein